MRLGLEHSPGVIRTNNSMALLSTQFIESLRQPPEENGGSSAPRRAQFGPYVIDTLTQELWKEGQRVSIPAQPLRVLSLLASRPGELVTRSEIRQEIWGEEAPAGADNSINAAINRIRTALDDPARSPQYVETLARRGYRFKGRVRWSEDAGIEVVRDPADGNLAIEKVRRTGPIAMAALILGLLALLALRYL